MWIFLIACLVLALFSGISFVSFLREHLVFLQHYCISSNPIDSDHQRLWAALTCGTPLGGVDFWFDTLKSSGLIHIFVVSGSHFLVLQHLLQRVLRLNPLWSGFTLWIFNGVTGFSAPGTRACLIVSGKNFFSTRSDQNILLASLFCIALNPNWVNSHSFWLSWLAALILTISPRDPLQLGSNFLFFLVWSLLGFSLSFWSLTLNILIAPLIGWLLFPLALLSYIPFVEILFSFSLSTLESLLRYLNLNPQATFKFRAIPHISFLVLSLHVFLQLYHLARQGRHLR